jgi:hypothetical protein
MNVLNSFEAGAMACRITAKSYNITNNAPYSLIHIQHIDLFQIISP